MASARSGPSTPEPQGAPSKAAPPEYVTRAPAGRYVGLNPTTKLTLAFAQTAIAFLLGGWTGPLLVLGVVLTTSVASGVTRRTWPFVLATIPLLVSIVLVNTLIYPGATDAFATIGPFTATWTGLTVALQATLRVIAFALSIAVFALTTTTDDLLSDLERRGLGRRAEFVIGAAISTVPRMLERAGVIVEAQRARGLDTEGRPWRRVRGLMPLAGPMITGALTEVEERTMALEARAFSAPGRRTTIRRLPDSTFQRVVRWAALLLVVGVVVGTAAGWLRLP